jgi:hypothetical protein
MRGHMGGGRGDQEDGCGQGGLGGGCEGGHGWTGGVVLIKVPLFWWYVPCRALDDVGGKGLNFLFTLLGCRHISYAP